MVTLFFVHLLLALIVSFIPKVGRYIAVFNTLIHENGHAITSLLLRGRVYSISLFANTEGQAITGYHNWVSKVIISYAGYTSASVFAYVCFKLIIGGYSQFLLYGLIIIVIINLVLWVRNPFGIVWLLIFGGVCYSVLRVDNSFIQTMFVMFFSSVLLIQSIISSYHIFILSIVKKGEAGDATSLAQATYLPSIFWGMLFLLQSLYVGYMVLKDMVF